MAENKNDVVLQSFRGERNVRGKLYADVVQATQTALRLLKDGLESHMYPAGSTQGIIFFRTKDLDKVSEEEYVKSYFAKWPNERKKVA